MHKRQRESGAVSLFLVIFAMLLITVVTLSFIRIMVADQQQSSTADLSQSAYDSAQAGTEDAKRALIYYRTLCANSDPVSCGNEATVINSDTCNDGLRDVVDNIPSDGVKIQQTQSDSDPSLNLNQSYTCVKMNLDTPNYLGTIAPDTSKIIPLKGVSDFDSVTIDWFLPSDLGSASTAVSLTNNSAATPLLLQSAWPVNRPPVMRAELMQFGSSFQLSDFDNSTATNSDVNTLFIYPTAATPVLNNPIDLAQQDVRKTATGNVHPTICSSNLSAGGYACETTLLLPDAIGETTTERTAYLRLTPFYNATHFAVTLKKAGLPVQFSAVQPSIDSTGRANTQYRRISTRVDLTNTNFVFPQSAVDITGGLCKNFSVTDNVNDFIPNTCTP